jgi:uncharacterized delta-60 repeat protein
VVTPVGSAASGVRSVAVQANGKIVVAGFAYDGTKNDFAVARYNANGTLDATFNHTGEVLTPFGSTPSAANGMALQADGKIVVVGEAGNDFAVARYNANGTLDATFNHTGEVLTAFAGSTAFANGVALQADGKIVVVGQAGTGFGIARYNANGTLDSSFDRTGLDPITFGSDPSDANAVVVQPDGKLVVAGTVSQGSENYFAAIRLKTNGALDGSFNHGVGGVAVPMGGDASATGVQLQADGKIDLAGTSNGQFAVLRLNGDGSLDTGFNHTGEATASFGGSFATASGVALAAHGKILVAGTADDDNTQTLDFALAQFNADGSLDTGFNGTGKVITALGSDAEAAGLAVQGDGKVVLAGSSDGAFALARYVPGPGTPAPTATITVLSSSVDASVFGQSVTFTADIIAAPGGAGGKLDGTVTFRDGASVLGTASVVDGKATWTTASLAVGGHDITASYSGNGGYAPSSSAPFSQVVVAAHTASAVTSSADPLVFGHAVTFTAHVYPVAPGAGMPTGVVTFFDGATVLGSRRLSHGSATLTVWRPLGAGPHPIRVIYYGCTDFSGSTSPVMMQSVKAVSNTSLTLGPGPGTSMLLTAVVTSASSGTPRPTGTVTFKDGKVVLGTVHLSASGEAVFQLKSPLAVGAHSFTAAYSGDGDFFASISLPVGIVVDPVG